MPRGVRWTPRALLALEPDPDRRALWAEDFRRAGKDLGDLDWLESARTLDPPPPEPDPDARWRAVQKALERAQELAGGTEKAPRRPSGEPDP